MVIPVGDEPVVVPVDVSPNAETVAPAAAEKEDDRPKRTSSIAMVLPAHLLFASPSADPSFPN